MNVLLVDDEAELVSTLAERLSLRGINACWATSGAEALRCLETAVFDIAVLDVKKDAQSRRTRAKKKAAGQMPRDAIHLRHRPWFGPEL